MQKDPILKNHRRWCVNDCNCILVVQSSNNCTRIGSYLAINQRSRLMESCPTAFPTTSRSLFRVRFNYPVRRPRTLLSLEPKHHIRPKHIARPLLLLVTVEAGHRVNKLTCFLSTTYTVAAAVRKLACGK